ncbi:hypothetical protein D3C87_955340 [compost metagenome]
MPNTIFMLRDICPSVRPRHFKKVDSSGHFQGKLRQHSQGLHPLKPFGVVNTRTLGVINPFLEKA